MASLALLALGSVCTACPKQNAAEKLQERAAETAPGDLPAETSESAPEKPVLSQAEPIPPPPAEPIAGEIRAEFPEQVKLVESQLAVMNNGDEAAYGGFIAADAPRRALLLSEFKLLIDQGLTYQLYDFESKTVAEGWVKGPLVLLATAPDGSATKYTYHYTFKRADDGTWRVYDMVVTGAEKLGARQP